MSLSTFTPQLGGIEGRQAVLETRLAAGRLRIYLDEAAEAQLRAGWGSGLDYFFSDVDRQRGVKRRGGWAQYSRLLLKLAVGVALFWLGYHLLIRYCVRFVPLRWDQAISHGYMRRHPSTNPALDTQLAELAKPLLAQIPDNPYTFIFRVQPTKGVNAYAVPGGLVVIHSGLIALADSPLEVQGVLAHEIQHILYRHSMEKMLHSAGLWIIFDALFTGAGPAAAMYSLSTLRYSREEEEEADRDGAALLQKAGLSPAGMASFFQKMDALHGNSSQWGRFLSTHPVDRERAEKLDALSRRYKQPAGARLGKPFAWTNFKARAAELSAKARSK